MEFLNSVLVAGDELHPERVVFVELKKRTDSAASNEALLLVIGGVQQVLHLVWKDG